MRSCEDVDEAAFTYAEVKALTTGNPYSLNSLMFSGKYQEKPTVTKAEKDMGVKSFHILLFK